MAVLGAVPVLAVLLPALVRVVLQPEEQAVALVHVRIRDVAEVAVCHVVADQGKALDLFEVLRLQAEAGGGRRDGPDPLGFRLARRALLGVAMPDPHARAEHEDQRRGKQEAAEALRVPLLRESLRRGDARGDLLARAPLRGDGVARHERAVYQLRLRRAVEIDGDDGRAGAVGGEEALLQRLVRGKGPGEEEQQDLALLRRVGLSDAEALFPELAQDLLYGGRVCGAVKRNDRFFAHIDLSLSHENDLIVGDIVPGQGQHFGADGNGLQSGQLPERGELAQAAVLEMQRLDAALSRERVKR